MANPKPSSPTPPIEKPPDPNFQKNQNPTTSANAENPSPSFTEKISFAALLTKSIPKPRFDNIPLPNRQYGTSEGLPTVSFSAAEFEAGARCFKFSLIAKFTIGRPNIDVIRQAMQANWDIKGRATLSEIWDGRHLLIILDSEEDMNAALTSSLRKIQHAMFRLFHYSPEYDPRKESTITTKWIRLPRLPPPLFHKNYIGAIVNSFAKFLDIDGKTKACASMRYARACIEFDVTQAVPEKVWVALPDGKSYWQRIEVEGNLSYCNFCKIHGHDITSCRKKKPAIMTNESGSRAIVDTSIKGNEYVPDAKGEWRVVKNKKAKQTSRNQDTTKQTEYGPDMLYQVTKPTSESLEEQNVTNKVPEEDVQPLDEGANQVQNIEEGNCHISHDETPIQETSNDEKQQVMDSPTKRYSLQDLDPTIVTEISELLSIMSASDLSARIKFLNQRFQDFSEASTPTTSPGLKFNDVTSCMEIVPVKTPAIVNLTTVEDV